MSRLGDRATIILPGATEEEWSEYRDAWIDARDLAWLVAECYLRPLGGAANTLCGHFVWHDLINQLIQLTGSGQLIIHKPLADITEDELPNKHFYARSWQYSNQKIQDGLGYLPARLWQATVAEVIKPTVGLHR